MATTEKFEQANRRGRHLLKTEPRAVEAHYDRRLGRVMVRLNTGLDVAFTPCKAQGLEAARPSQLRDIEISPSGLGLYFPKLDADLYLPALLDGYLGSRSWMASQLGSAGGRVKSTVKVQASRENGRLGGRPRKVAS